jgi:PAS domain S-box-containing protein
MTREGDMDTKVKSEHGAPSFADLVDVPALQSMMDDFFELAQVPTAVIDLEGVVIVGSGWQDVCTKFHRVNPESCVNCIESDTVLTADIPEGESRLYECKNGLWDAAMPVVVDGIHIANVFTGQFFFGDTPVDADFFKRQAQRYGFDESEYLAAIAGVPRLSRSNVQTSLDFLTKLAGMLSQMGLISLENTRLYEERLADSEKYARGLLEASPDSLVTISPEGKISDVNAATELITGLSRDVLIGTDFSDYFTDPEQARKGYEKVFSEQQVRDYPLVVRNIDGSTTDVLYNASLYFDDKGATAGVFAAARDVTELNRAQEKLRQSVENLERSNRDLEQFAYVASHDLQEPLRMVSSYTQLLAERYSDKLDDDARDFIGFAVDGSIRMQTLINDLLQYARVGTRGGELTATDTRVALAHALTAMHTRIQETGAVLSVGDLPTVLADELQITQLFQNLIGNAIKFAKADEAPHIDISALWKRGEWIFSVADNGVGIDPKYQERVFEIFQRLHSRTEYSGTGIGLAICKRIVERHGGRIWVESEVGHGATFKFSLPGPRNGAQS